jgi:hypothetical protein
MNGGKEMVKDFQQEIADRRLTLKKDIKRTGGNCTRILLILAISTYVLSFATIFGIKYIGGIFGIDTASNPEANVILGISSDKYNFFVGYLTCIIGDIIAIIIAMKTTKIKIRKDIFSKNKSPKMFILLGTISCIGIGMISSMFYLIYSTILMIFGLTIPEPDFSFPKQSEYLALFLIYVCFLGPVLEEIIFRGFILKSMQKYGNLTAIIVSSILFSMFHLNLVQFVNPILMGIVLAFIAIKSKSIVPSIIAHIFNNTIIFIAAGISLLKIQSLEWTFGVVYFLVGVIAFVVFINRYRKDFMKLIKEDTRILKTREKIKFAFSGAWSLVYITFYIMFITVTMIATNILK